MSEPDNLAPMSFGQAIKSVYGQYARFRGRARRSEYWYYWLFGLVLSVVSGIIDVIIGSPIVQIVLIAVSLVPGFAVTVRRLHDTGRSGWATLYLLIPIAGPIVLVVFECQDSQRGTNRYGTSPKYPSPIEAPAGWQEPTSTSERSNVMPLIVAAACVVLTAALLVAFLHVHTVSRQHGSGGSYGLTKDQQAAVLAGATEAANVTTYSRKTFDADFARAINGATGDLKTDLIGKKALALNTMTSGKFDLKGTVGTSAYVGQTDDGKGVLVLVTVNAFQVADASTGSTSSVQRFELTMVKSGKHWLATNLNAVGIE